MITLTKSGNAIVFTFDDNDHYLNDGTIEVPVNSLTLVTDESQMATFRKSASNDVFISARYDELGMSKSDLESWFKTNACSTGGGGGGGVTPEEVQDMIDESISGKADTSDVATVSGDVSTLSGQVETDEKVTATALNDLNNRLSNYYTKSETNEEINSATSNKVDYNDVTNTVQKDSDELVKSDGIFNKVAYTTSGSAVVTGETTEIIGIVRSGGRWGNRVELLQTWCLAENICEISGGELRMSFDIEISELNITIGDMGGNSFTVRYNRNQDNLEADNATVEWADATTKLEIIITDYPTIDVNYIDTDLTEYATVIPVEDDTTHVQLKYVYSSEQTIETTHWVVDEIKDKADTSAVTALSEKVDTNEEVTSRALNTLNEALSGKQDTLVSGTNIKTINNESILGSGNITIQGGGGGGINVVQTTGTSSADVMSQNAVTTELNNKTAKGDAIGDYTFGETNGKAFVKFQKANSSFLSELYFSKINNKEVWGITNINACKNWELVETSAITTSVTSSSTDSQVPSAKAVYDQFGGLKLVQLTQAQYDALTVKDPQTLYFITNVVN